MRKYRAYDEMTRSATGLYVELNAEGGIASAFVTHGPVGFTVSAEEYVAKGYTPDLRSLPTMNKLKPDVDLSSFA